MIIASRGQLVRQEGEAHSAGGDNLRAHGIGGPLCTPSRGCANVRGILRWRPEPPRRLFWPSLPLRQIMLRKIRYGGDGLAEVSLNLEKYI